MYLMVLLFYFLSMHLILLFDLLYPLIQILAHIREVAYRSFLLQSTSLLPLPIALHFRWSMVSLNFSASELPPL